MTRTGLYRPRCCAVGQLAHHNRRTAACTHHGAVVVKDHQRRRSGIARTGAAAFRGPDHVASFSGTKTYVGAGGHRTHRRTIWSIEVGERQLEPLCAIVLVGGSGNSAVPITMGIKASSCCRFTTNHDLLPAYHADDAGPRHSVDHHLRMTRPAFITLARTWE